MKNTIAAAVIAAGFSSVAQAADIDVVKALYSDVLDATTSPDLPVRMENVLAPDWKSIGDYKNGPAKTRDQFLVQLQRMGRTAPNLRWQIEEVLQMGNRYVVRGRATATPTATFFGHTPTGREFDIMAIDIHTVEGGKIVMSYHVEDWHGAIEQLTAH